MTAPAMLVYAQLLPVNLSSRTTAFSQQSLHYTIFLRCLIFHKITQCLQVFIVQILCYFYLFKKYRTHSICTYLQGHQPVTGKIKLKEKKERKCCKIFEEVMGKFCGERETKLKFLYTHNNMFVCLISACIGMPC